MKRRGWSKPSEKISARTAPPSLPRSGPPRAHSEMQVVRLIWLAIFVSVFSFLFYNRQGDVLLYGDAVAHINIARRVFDSQTPGLLQLGTVWLPLPHLLILPFIVSTRLWQSGAGGSIPSMAGFVFGVLGIFRLGRGLLGGEQAEGAARMAAWAAAILYAANPNLIYMQATAMGESLYLAFFVWAVGYFAEFARGNAKALTRCGLCLAGACLTRYDGWFLAVILVVSAAASFPLLAKDARSGAPRASSESRASSAPRASTYVSGASSVSSWKRLAIFVLLAAAGPALWLGYNAAVYRNPLEFANGPYSAKAIAEKSATVNPAKGNLMAGTSYFVKAAELNISQTKWLGRLWLGLALVGSAAAWVKRRGRAALLLWAPLPFYALNVTYGSVPIFLPAWWPFTYYNVRYGLQLLPAFAVFVPLGIAFLVEMAAKIPQLEISWKRWADAAMLLGVLGLAGASYGMIWRADPVCYSEARINSRGRIALDKQIADWIKFLPPQAMFLMYLGEHVGAMQQAAVPLRRVINEGNHRMWRQPADPEGLWERALAHPAGYADYVIGFEGDPAWKAAKEAHLTALVEIHTTGQAPAAIFQARQNTSSEQSR